MGYKSRGNYAPCGSLTDDEFSKIFMVPHKFYVTFGSNHIDPDGNSLGKKYSTIIATDEETANKIIFDTYGEVFAFMYREDEDFGKEEYNLTEYECVIQNGLEGKCK